MTAKLMSGLGLFGRGSRRIGEIGFGAFSRDMVRRQASLSTLNMGVRRLGPGLLMGAGAGAAGNGLVQMGTNMSQGDSLFSGMPGAMLRGAGMGAGLGGFGRAAWRMGRGGGTWQNFHALKRGMASPINLRQVPIAMGGRGGWF